MPDSSSPKANDNLARGDGGMPAGGSSAVSVGLWDLFRRSEPQACCSVQFVPGRGMGQRDSALRTHGLLLKDTTVHDACSVKLVTPPRGKIKSIGLLGTTALDGSPLMGVRWMCRGITRASATGIVDRTTPCFCDSCRISHVHEATRHRRGTVGRSVEHGTGR